LRLSLLCKEIVRLQNGSVDAAFCLISMNVRSTACD
jgi:hypothetical protein